MVMEFLRGDVELFAFVCFVVAVIVGITIHEFAHAYRAMQAGDPTPGRQGRLTLNPLAHYDPLGTTLLLVLGLGWGRAVQTQPSTYRHPRRDSLMIALWGPLSNVLLAVGLMLQLRFAPIPWLPWRPLALTIVFWNLWLAFFNLIPVTPLDGSKVLSALLPVEQANSYDRFMMQYGRLVFLLLIFGGRPLIETWVATPSHFLLDLFLPRNL